MHSRRSAINIVAINNFMGGVLTRQNIYIDINQQGLWYGLLEWTKKDFCDCN